MTDDNHFFDAKTEAKSKKARTPSNPKPRRSHKTSRKTNKERPNDNVGRSKQERKARRQDRNSRERLSSSSKTMPEKQSSIKSKKKKTKKMKTSSKTPAKSRSRPIFEIAATNTSIVEYMEMPTIHHDKKEVVREWVAANPVAVAVLTPTDLAMTMTKISFALEHPEVVDILTKAIVQNGGSITTEHILAAMKVSPTQDFLIVQSMAPFVMDPENKDTVMDALRTSFEQDRIYRCFRRAEHRCTPRSSREASQQENL